MSGDNLHPSVKEFKTFINEHPKLIEEIRKNGRSWQEYYEKWALLGEDDPLWETYLEEQEKQEKNDKKKSEIFSQLMKLTENLDLEKVQKQVHQFNGTISTLQEVLGQFQDTKKAAPINQNQRFNWFRD